MASYKYMKICLKAEQTPFISIYLLIPSALSSFHLAGAVLVSASSDLGARLSIILVEAFRRTFGCFHPHAVTFSGYSLMFSA